MHVALLLLLLRQPRIALDDGVTRSSGSAASSTTALLSSPPWCRTLMIGYHAGLFAALFFGQIGFQGRKQQYW